MKEKIKKSFFNIIWKLAKIHLKKKDVFVIWVTWSIWKTTSRMIISKILSDNDINIYTSPKNYNWSFWLSLSIFEISDYVPTKIWFLKILLRVLRSFIFSKPSYDVLFLEYGIDEVGEMDFLLDVVKPDISIFTWIDKVHCLNFSSPDVTAEEKIKLVKNTKNVSFLNYDDSYTKNSLNVGCDIIYFTTTGKDNAQIWFEKFDYVYEDGKINSKFKWKINNLDINISTNILWKENAWYITLWYAILDIVYRNFWYNNSVVEWMWDLSLSVYSQPGRFSIFEGINWSVLIDSTYNASPESTKKVINNTANIKDKFYSNHSVIFVFGDMRELGDFSEQEHRLMASYILWFADYVFLLWENTKSFTYDELSKIWFDMQNVFLFANSYDLWDYLNNFLKKNSEEFLVLFKWSQTGIFLEEALKKILKNQEDGQKLPRQEFFWKKV